MVVGGSYRGDPRVIERRVYGIDRADRRIVRTGRVELQREWLGRGTLNGEVGDEDRN